MKHSAMDMNVYETGQDQAALGIDHFHGIGGFRGRSGGRADIRDDAVLDGHGSIGNPSPGRNDVGMYNLHGPLSHQSSPPAAWSSTTTTLGWV
ncbi:hypothetical protein D1872_245570 [compost metagenome]